MQNQNFKKSLYYNGRFSIKETIFSSTTAKLRDIFEFFSLFFFFFALVQNPKEW